ncbi:hypothetical protein AVEN_242818-1 [Araneus ventricosus]|uniref:Uncharacterized protein n=1 Tax=Araneus ventricosus TaxID=182803 RepID=A0A4Y2WUT5_ARAVE|nr:hypothetical protein AVEN_242818-1 [Araneus ventricosus]
MRAHFESQVEGIKDHVSRCIGKMEEDVQGAEGVIEKVQRKIEEVETKFKGRSATSRRDLVILRTNQTISQLVYDSYIPNQLSNS